MIKAERTSYKASRKNNVGTNLFLSYWGKWMPLQEFLDKINTEQEAEDHVKI